MFAIFKIRFQIFNSTYHQWDTMGHYSTINVLPFLFPEIVRSYKAKG